MTEGSGDSTAPLVLVGDDEAMVRDLVCEVLREAGYRTLTASDGEEVVELALRHQPVLIAVDLMMPKMDGYTTVTRLRGHPLTAGIPVIVLTGQSNPLYRTLSQGVGATAHLTKPFSPHELIETVRRVLGEAAG